MTASPAVKPDYRSPQERLTKAGNHLDSAAEHLTEAANHLSMEGDQAYAWLIAGQLGHIREIRILVARALTKLNDRTDLSKAGKQMTLEDIDEPNRHHS